MRDDLRVRTRLSIAFPIGFPSHMEL
jgi:hypothetical protein